MKKYAKEYDYTWNVVRPSFIVGCPQEVNSLNAGLAYALYLAICKEMGQEAVEFPGTYTNYYDYCDQSWDTMNACLEEWAVLTPGAANEDFNVQDGGELACLSFQFLELKSYPRRLVMVEALATHGCLFRSQGQAFDGG